MLVISPIKAEYLFGYSFKASFDAEDNLSYMDDTAFSGFVEHGCFSVGDYVYVMNNNYKIVIDSSGELPEELKKDGHFSNVPLSIDIDGETFVDDEIGEVLDGQLTIENQNSYRYI